MNSPTATLKIRIAAPPERGRANAALFALLAERYHVSRSAINHSQRALRLSKADPDRPLNRTCIL